MNKKPQKNIPSGMEGAPSGSEVPAGETLPPAKEGLIARLADNAALIGAVIGFCTGAMSVFDKQETIAKAISPEKDNSENPPHISLSQRLRYAIENTIRNTASGAIVGAAVGEALNHIQETISNLPSTRKETTDKLRTIFANSTTSPQAA